MTDGEYRWVKQYLIQQVFDLENRNIVLAGVNVDIDVQNGRKKLCASLKKVQKVPIG